jgi:hypothetical protein
MTQTPPTYLIWLIKPGWKGPEYFESDMPLWIWRQIQGAWRNLGDGFDCHIFARLAEASIEELEERL